MSRMYNRFASRNRPNPNAAKCGCCGKATYRNIHPEFPECSHGCAEHMVDRDMEDRGGW